MRKKRRSNRPRSTVNPQAQAQLVRKRRLLHQINAKAQALEAAKRKRIERAVKLERLRLELEARRPGAAAAARKITPKRMPRGLRILRVETPFGTLKRGKFQTYNLKKKLTRSLKQLLIPRLPGHDLMHTIIRSAAVARSRRSEKRSVSKSPFAELAGRSALRARRQSCVRAQRRRAVLLALGKVNKAGGAPGPRRPSDQETRSNC